MNSLELEENIQARVEGAGFRLLRALWKPLRGRQLLRVIVDAEDHNITIDECANLSRTITDLLDSYPHDFPDYRLEVSSPGLDHPLEKWQIRKNVGRRVQIEYLENGAPRTCTGEMIAADNQAITVAGPDETRSFPLDSFRRIVVLPKF